MSSTTPPGTPRLSRRQLLRGVGALGLAGLLAACGDRGGTGAAPTDGASSPRDIRQAIKDQLGIAAPLDLSLIVPSAIFTTGTDRRIMFGVGTSPTDTLSDLDLSVHLVNDVGLEVVAGPLETSFHDEGLGERGVYLVTTDLEDGGRYWLAASSEEHAAIGALTVYPSDQVAIPDQGESFPSAETPTVDDAMGLEDLCTREPQCSMHDISLDAALAEGRPTVMTIATPAYCQTAICGPVVDVVEGLKQGAGRDDVAWIHVEVYSDAGTTPIPMIQQQGALPLPSEPWTFFIAADGTLADRYEGPTPADLLRGSLSRI